MTGDAPGGGVPTRLLNQVNAFKYVTVQNAPTYRAVVQVFYEAAGHYRVGYRPTEALEAVRAAGLFADVADADELETQCLDQLVAWGILVPTHDAAGVDRLRDYYRRRLIYHLTEVGEAAHRAVLEVEATVGRSGSLQTNMLVKIRDGLRELAVAPIDDPELLLRLLHDVESAFDTLTREATRFMTDLGRLTAEERGGATPERFAAYKQAVLAYVGRFVEELRRIRDEIVEGLAAVEARGVAALIAAASASADLPDFEADGAARARWAADQREKWAGIARWFVGADGAEGEDAEATVERLAAFAVGAVLTLTRTLGRLNDRRGRPVDRTTDFLTLARWFAMCPDDTAAHELWHVAFGLHPARHLHLAEEDPDLTSTRASWWDADPVVVPTRLRTHGSYSRGGYSPRAADFSRQRRWLAVKARRERAQLDAAIARFVGRAPRLSELAALDGGEFDLLLGLLDAALTASRDSDGTRTSRTGDGRLLVALHPPGDGAFCELTTPAGRLRCLDYRLEVVDLAAPVQALRGTG